MKEKLTGELSQSVFKVILFKQGNFHSCLQEKDAITSLSDVYFTQGKLDVFARKKHTLSSLKNLDLDWASISNRAQRQLMIGNRPFHNVVLVQGVTCNSLNLVLR